MTTDQGSILSSSDDQASMQALTTAAGSSDIATWSEDKKKDFVNIFQQRSKAARALLLLTGRCMVQIAEGRKLISQKHISKSELNPYDTFSIEALYDPKKGTGYNEPRLIGGREIKELEVLARKRAEAILEELPSIRKATEVILPDIAKKMDRRDALIEQGKKLLEELDAVCEPLTMSSLPESTTIAKYKELVEDRADKRDAICKKLDKVGIEGCALDDAVNTALYAGLPGVSEAVIKVIKDHAERSTMFDQMGRRVEEKVRFGDSDAALELLKGFEKDEIVVSDNIKSEFSRAIATLNLAGLRRNGRTLPKLRSGK